MATQAQHLLTLANRSYRPCQSLLALSTSLATSFSHVKTCNSPNYSTLAHDPPIQHFVSKITTLPNGLRVATESCFASNTASVGVWIDAGSGIESLKTSGTGFFLKRMLVKGTERRTQRQLEEEIKTLGGHVRADSNRDYTYYCAKVTDKDVPKALDIISDIVQYPKLKKRKIESARHEILKYMKEQEEETERAIFDHLQATAFPDSPIGRTPYGPAENVKTITKKDLLNYMSSHYTASRMVIVACGAVKHEEIVEQVKSLFTKLPEGSTTTSKLAANDKTIFKPSEVRIYDDNVPLAHFMVAFNGPSCTELDLIITLDVMGILIGDYSKSSGSSEQTSSALVDRLGISDIAEEMRTFTDYHRDAGLFGVYAAAKPDCLDVLAHSIMYAVIQLCYKVSEDDVVQARNKLKSLIKCPKHDSVDDWIDATDNTGYQVLHYGRRLSYRQLRAWIDAVDADTVKRVANRFIFDKDVAIAAIGPIQDLPNYDWFRRRTCSWNKN
ncbi:Mitochondrial processing peptidase, beta subunit, and related enzymes (Insulinase superfamily) [Heracleum sosnowskyi]|uniref:Mitochondrial processing peptidase, beta subunit, and related enzymes (Insulinase superfamily) n=1 Tax=Heracleum sosnowskyi TaxID=360622 RepID=A0AAD8IEI1_9APIA|nr:Mitochondrial processing peptidase, beta subunit, and related enzymes (Insulinase superfamily) [Heracleum sosnowskyi]